MIDKKTYVDISFTGVDSTINFSLSITNDYSINDLIIENKDLNVRPGDSLYFAPKVSVPRVKVKNLTIDYGAKVTRDISKADIIIIPENFENILFESNYKYLVDKEQLLLYLDYDKRIDYHSLAKLNDVLDTHSNVEFVADWSNFSQLKNLANVSSFVFNSHSVVITGVSDFYSSIYEDLKGKTLHKESQILKFINGDDALIINGKIFEQLTAMFKSSDNDNHTIAMEMMSNCNYVDSLFYLELLFKDFSYIIKENYARNHVNFKSLCRFLSKSNDRYMHTDFDDIINSLIKHDKLSEEYLNILINKFIDDIYYVKSEYFNIHTITLKEELLILLNKNYKIKLVEDFTPENIQETEVEDTVIEKVEINSQTVKWI